MVPHDSDDRPDLPLTADSHQAAPESPLPESQETSFLWLTNRDQWLIVLVSIVVVILLVMKWQQLRYIDRSEIILQRSSDDIGYQIELNSATWVELTQLRGIGEAFAQRIVNDRDEHGPFSSIDDLQRVKGIGPKTVEKNRRWLRVESMGASTE